MKHNLLLVSTPFKPGGRRLSGSGASPKGSTLDNFIVVVVVHVVLLITTTVELFIVYEEEDEEEDEKKKLL